MLKKHLTGQKRYPLVLMLEPLFRCNLACAGCGKIDYPDDILNQRLSYEQCMESIDECGAPGVVIAGGEPLLHRDLPRIVQGCIERKKVTIVCTNALLLKKHIDKFKPNRFFSWSIHLDGDQAMHDKAVCQDGVFDTAVEAIKLAKSKGFRTQINCTLFEGAEPERMAAFMDEMKALGVGVTLSPGYAYERAPDQAHFLNRQKTKSFFREMFARGKGKKWEFTQSRPLPELPRRQRDLRMHAVVHAPAHRVRLAEALLPPRRRLCADLQGIDGGHQVGRLRRRQL